MTTGMVRGDFSFLLMAGGVALLLGFLVPSACAEQPSLLSDKPTAPMDATLRTGLSGEQIVEHVSPSVALILVGQGGEQATAVGSGVIVKPDGKLLTALHLVKGADTVQVRLKNGEIYDRVDLMIHPASGTIVGSGKVIAWDFAPLKVMGTRVAHTWPFMCAPRVGPVCRDIFVIFSVFYPGVRGW